MKALINKKELYTVLKNSIKTSSSDIYLSDLNSIYFDFLDDNTLNIVSTDSRQMAIYNIKYEGSKLNNFSIKSNEVKKILKELKDIEHISSNINAFINNINNDYIEIDNIIYTKTNNFPDYKRIIPNKENNSKLYNIILSNENIIKIKKAVRTIQKEAKEGRIIIYFKYDKIILTADKDIGPHTIIIIDNIQSGIDYILCLNYKHILNIFHQCVNNQINIEIYKNKPIKVINGNNTFLCMQYIAENNILIDNIKKTA